MKLQLHKYIFKMMVGLFIVSPSFVYAEGFKISLYPSKAEQVVSCVSFFAHKISVSDLTEFEYRKLLALAKYDLNIQTLQPLPNGNGESQEEAKEELRKRMLEIVQLGISHHVYEEVLNYVKTLEENNENSSPTTTQTNRNKKVNENEAELEALKQQAREVILKYPDIIEDPNNLDLRNKDKETYLHLAAKENIAVLVEALLLLNPILIDEKDFFSNTALISAAYNGHNDVVKMLLENGANPNLQNYDKWTALIRAAFRGDNDVVKALLEKGADPNLQERDGKTALFWAEDGGNTEAVELLRAYGAK